MKRFKKEILLFAVVFVVAIAGLLQLFQEEAYAVIICSDPGSCNCSGEGNPTQSCLCTFLSPSPITCGYWCTHGRPECEVGDPGL